MKITQQELIDRINALSKKKKNRAQSSLANWELGKTVTMLADPEEARVLAEALEWDLNTMFQAAGYPAMDLEGRQMSESVQKVIDEIHQLKPHLVDAFCHMLVHFIRDFRNDLSDIDPKQLIQDVDHYASLPIQPYPNDDSEES